MIKLILVQRKGLPCETLAFGTDLKKISWWIRNHPTENTKIRAMMFTEDEVKAMRKMEGLEEV